MMGILLEKFIAGAVQHPSYRIIRPPHDALHAHHSAQVVAAMNAHRAGGAYQDVLVVVGHADDFVRHDLADGEHQVESSLGNHAVYLRRPGVVEQAAGLLLDEAGRQFAQRDHIGAPVVHREERVRDVPKHAREHRRRHRGVGSQGRQNAAQTVAVVLVGVLGQRASLGVEAAKIRRHGQNLAFRPEPIQRPVKRLAEKCGGKLSVWAAHAAVETHSRYALRARS